MRTPFLSSCRRHNTRVSKLFRTYFNEKLRTLRYFTISHLFNTPYIWIKLTEKYSQEISNECGIFLCRKCHSMCRLGIFHAQHPILNVATCPATIHIIRLNHIGDPTFSLKCIPFQLYRNSPGVVIQL